MRPDFKKFGALALAAGATSALVLGITLFVSQPASAEPITLRLHTFVPPVSGSYKSLAWWAQKVEKDSGGRLKIQIFGSMQLGGKAPDVYDQVKNGVVDLGWTLPGYTAGLFPITLVFELPFIGGRAEIVSPAVNAFLEKYGKKEWGDVHPIVFHSAGISAIHMRTKKLEKLEDFKGLKIRTPSRISSAALTALGATPVPMPLPKITEALLHGVVDGAVLPWSIARAIRTIDVAKYHIDSTLHGPVLALLMNKQSYAKLPPDLKKVIDNNSGEWLAKELGRRWEQDDVPSRVKAKKLGHEIIEIPDAEQDRWREATKSVYDSWVKSMDAKGLPGRAMLEDAERLVAKYKAEAKSKSK
jgi:TRAP-type transport system periplasmic protein